MWIVLTSFLPHYNNSLAIHRSLRLPEKSKVATGQTGMEETNGHWEVQSRWRGPLGCAA